jgi:DNA-binding PadR family transcriptional regulator
MGVRHAVLGLLIERPSYGYELMQRLEDRFPGWGWRPNGIYEALNKLESDKQARSIGDRAVSHGRRAAPRTIYEATPQGQAFYREWFAERSPLSPVRQELDMKIQLADREALPVLIELMQDQEIVCLGELRGLTGVAPASSVTTWEEAAAVLRRNAQIKGLQFRIERLQEARSAAQALLARRST